ncbi:DUF4231 domain-containing protein [Nocardiopsis sp. NPDC006198]|uniref:DUF4231 domain-containing protein n=1 Tax=Nocardiopsis sp. NPDC006198 TaxID=3154472 RepID=UPI0033BABBE0
MGRVRYEDLPALLRAADTNSLSGQRRLLLITRVQLASLVAAAGFGMLSLQGWAGDAAAVLAAVAFGTALVTEVYRLKDRPDRLWYTGRAVAESAKTLTWRYMVGGAPLGLGEVDADRADTRLLDRFRDIASDVDPASLVPAEGSTDEITCAMRRARALPLADRRDLYLRERLDDQRAWYADKSRWNAGRSTLWSVGLASLELVGLALGIARAAGLVEVDLLGFAAAVVAAGAAWVQTKQHQGLATAYGIASHEIALIRARAEQEVTEQEWARFVSDAEEAISREHTLWRASRGGG